MHDKAVANSRDDLDGAVRVADPDMLCRLDQRPVIPGIADFAAMAKEVAALPVTPIEIAERAERAEGRGNADPDAPDEEAGADHQTKEHAAANELATPRAPKTPCRCSGCLIQRHVHGYGLVRSSIL